MDINNAISRLTYLRDNSAEVEVREALNLAINNLNRTKCQNKLIRAKRDLDKITDSYNSTEFNKKVEEATKDLQYPEHEWIPSTVKELLMPLILEEHMDDGERTTISIKNEDLNRLVRILEDDGMGYGASNGYAFTSEIYDGDYRLWI